MFYDMHFGSHRPLFAQKGEFLLRVSIAVIAIVNPFLYLPVNVLELKGWLW